MQAGLNAALSEAGSDVQLDFKDSGLAKFVAGNPISDLFAGDLPTYELSEHAFNAGLGSKPHSVGRRVGDILALNIAGKGGRPLATGAANLGAMRIAEGVEKALGLGFGFWQRMAVDAALTAIEAAVCYSLTQ